MTRLVFACTITTTTLVFGLGCQLPNPAFNADQGEGGDGTSTGDTSDASAEGGTTASTNSGTTTGDGDADGDTTDEGPLDTGMEAPDPILDLPPDACVVPITEGLRPRFGAPGNFDGGQCQLNVNGYVRVIGTEAGDWVAQPCKAGCDTCDEGQELIIGGQSLKLAMLMPPVQLEPDLSWIGCHFVQAESLVSGDGAGCIYRSLSIHTDEGPTTALLFNANRESWGLTTSANAKLGSWTPPLEDQVDAEQCDCAELDINCCEGHTVIAKKFALENNVFVYPGEDDFTTILQQPWHFFGVQAQAGVVCEPSPETSWAIQPVG